MSTESSLVFSGPWCERWADALRSSDAYRRAAAEWEGAIVLRLDENGDGLGVWADLHRGDCRECRPMRPSDLEEAAFVLAADEPIWRDLLDGSLEPFWALMSRKIRLDRGQLGKLVPYASAAKELVAAARTVPTHFDRSATEPTPFTAPAAAEPATEGRGPDGGSRFQSTSSRGLDWDHPMLQLWEKAKERGVWNPAAIDFSRDRADWATLTDEERDVVLRLSTLFLGGEEAVTLDLLPLVAAIARDGQLEEEIYLTSFLWEEAKHVEFFRRFLDGLGISDDLAHYQSPAWSRLFEHELPEALGALWTDSSPAALARASTVYNMIVEGVLAETGYHAFFTMLEARDLMPGVRHGVALLKSDEARHLAFGVHLLTRLVSEHGEPVLRAIDETMQRLLPTALAVIDESFDAYDVMPFGLDQGEMTEFATRQFRSRAQRIGVA